MKNVQELPGLNCGLCGYKLCDELAAVLQNKPDMIKRCIHLSKDSISFKLSNEDLPASSVNPKSNTDPINACPSAASRQTTPTPIKNCGECSCVATTETMSEIKTDWKDSLDREFDFYIEHFPEDPGPREVIIPRNAMITRELDVKIGDILIGRPLGISCGCPITHCGIVTNVDQVNGVIVWCVTGPLKPREQGYKDIGYYSAEAYEGMVRQTRVEIKIGMRYYFQPRMCMLQWRHSGLVNYINKTPDGLQIRVEGLWIG